MKNAHFRMIIAGRETGFSSSKEPLPSLLQPSACAGPVSLLKLEVLLIHGLRKKHPRQAF
jgi:hypothetical protein